MTAEKLMDAMNYLPEELIEKTDTVRRRKGFSWKPLAALAACLCLVAGLWFINPGAKAGNSVGKDNASPEYGNMGAISDQSASVAGAVFYVEAVYDDHIIVKRHKMDEMCDCPAIVVEFGKLEEIPLLFPGQRIRIYTHQDAIGTLIVPYKIEIEEE